MVVEKDTTTLFLHDNKELNNQQRQTAQMQNIKGQICNLIMHKNLESKYLESDPADPKF